MKPLKRFNTELPGKTPKGKIVPIRIVTKDHEAYKIYQKGVEIQMAVGVPMNGNIVEHRFIEEAKKQLGIKVDD